MAPTLIPSRTEENSYPDSTAYWIDPRFPDQLRTQIETAIQMEPISEKENADVIISTEMGNPIGQWYYALVSPFPSPTRNISLSELQAFWQGKVPALEKSDLLYVSGETRSALEMLWGPPTPQKILVREETQFLDELWTDPDALAVIPLPSLEPRWNVHLIDGFFPLQPEVLDSYPLTVPVRVHVNQGEFTIHSEHLGNFDPGSLTRVALTGVTAMVRDTAAIMEDKGIEYPAIDVGPILTKADITHISNEVPFAQDCPSPDPNQESLYFCSSDSYIDLLEAVGTDVVELSGDHFGDWGGEAMLHTLTLYQERGWKTYGGGKTLSAGLEPVYFEHNGNQLVFIGCNAKAHDRYATASETEPGASRCDFAWMEAEIARLSAEGHLVIATMQHEEIDSFLPVAVQIYDFQNLAEAGAVIVSGSQAHHPQTFEFYQDAFIHYGLGNLFFDQYYLANYNPKQHLNKDKAFIDVHSFYRGAHINTRLIPIQFIDNARPRPMTAEESRPFLTEVFSAARWLENLSSRPTPTPPDP